MVVYFGHGGIGLKCLLYYSFYYSYFDIAKDWQDRDLIQIDNKKKQISIPVVIAGTDNDVGLGRVTNNRIIYQYDGRLFRRIKN